MAIGAASPIHSTNEMRTPTRSSSMAIVIRLGGVPTGVAMPPNEQPYAVINITAVP